MTKILSIHKLAKHYDGVAAVKDATFDVVAKEIVAITGENGAGKTTLFNLLMGLQSPETGKVILNDQDLTGRSPLEIARSGMARLYQYPRLFKNLTVLDNVVAASEKNPGASLWGLLSNPAKARRADRSLRQSALDLLRLFGLDRVASRTSGELSFGERKLVSFSMLAFCRPDLGLLDEPFSGLNPRMVERMCEIIRQLRKEGMTFLLIEHNISKALDLADRHIEMVGGVTREAEG